MYRQCPVCGHIAPWSPGIGAADADTRLLWLSNIPVRDPKRPLALPGCNDSVMFQRVMRDGRSPPPERSSALCILHVQELAGEGGKDGHSLCVLHVQELAGEGGRDGHSLCVLHVQGLAGEGGRDGHSLCVLHVQGLAGGGGRDGHSLCVLHVQGLAGEGGRDGHSLCVLHVQGLAGEGGRTLSACSARAGVCRRGKASCTR